MLSLRFRGAILIIQLLSVALTQAAKSVIHNDCDFPVWIWEVPHQSETIGPLANGHKIEPGRCFANNLFQTVIGGVAVKLSLHSSLNGPWGPHGITQFEYTINPPDPTRMWYDMSNVDCDGHQTIKGDCPFWQHGMMLINGNCVSETCDPGERNCREIYQVWNDDHATTSCNISDNHDAEIFLCSAHSTRTGLTWKLGKASQCEGPTHAGQKQTSSPSPYQTTSSSKVCGSSTKPTSGGGSLSTWLA